MTSRKKAAKTAAPIDPNAFAKAFFDGIVSSFAIDEDKAYGRGIEFAFGTHGYLLIHYAGTGNKAYLKAQKDFAEKHGAKIATMTDKEQAAHMAKLYADTIVVGLLTPDKQPVPYTADVRDMCAAALTKAENLLERLIVAAKNEANFYAEQKKAHAKN